MFNLLKRSNPLVMVAAERGKSGHSLILELVLFLLVFAVASLPAAACAFLLPQDGSVLPSLLPLLCSLVSIGVVLLYCTVVEKRPRKTLGLVKRGGRDYAEGVVYGLALFLPIFVLGLLTNAVGLGGFRFEGVSASASPLVLLFLLGWLLHGMSAELLFHGYFTVSAARKSSLTAAVVTSSLLFSLAHALEAGFGAVALVNSFLFAFFLGIFMLRTGGIWGAAAIHSVWCFLQSGLLGLADSHASVPVSVFSYSANGSVLLSGGEYGVEGSLLTTLALLGAILLVFYRSRSKRDF